MIVLIIVFYLINYINYIHGKVNTFTYSELESSDYNKKSNKSINHKEAWLNIPLPKASLFKGMPTPNDTIKWNRSKQQAARGSLVLLRRVKNVIKNPHDLIQTDRPIRWAHKIADFLLDKETKWDPNSFISKYEEVDRSLIVLAGHKQFKDNNFEGDEINIGVTDYSPRDMIDDMKAISIPVPTILLGFPEENTCWVGTYFLNRTVSNLFNDGTMGGPLRKEKNEIYKLLDHPNIVAVITHQHHNLSHHPKVLSLPLGVDDSKSLWDTINSVYNKIFSVSRRMEYKKDHLLFSASSSFGARPMIIDCVKARIKDSFFILSEKVDLKKYYQYLIKSYAVLAIPGMVIFTLFTYQYFNVNHIY